MMNETKIEPLTVRFAQASQMSGLSHWTLRAAAKTGDLKVVKRGRAVLIPLAELRRFLDGGQR